MYINTQSYFKYVASRTLRSEKRQFIKM